MIAHRVLQNGTRPHLRSPPRAVERRRDSGSCPLRSSGFCRKSAVVTHRERAPCTWPGRSRAAVDTGPTDACVLGVDAATPVSPTPSRRQMVQPCPIIPCVFCNNVAPSSSSGRGSSGQRITTRTLLQGCFRPGVAAWGKMPHRVCCPCGVCVAAWPASRLDPASMSHHRRFCGNRCPSARQRQRTPSATAWSRAGTMRTHLGRARRPSSPPWVSRCGPGAPVGCR